MGVMDRFAKLDSAMQRGLDNGLARVFGGKVVPAEIEELLKQEIADNIVRTYEGYVEAPNLLNVEVSAKDFANLTESYPNLPRDFADQINRHIRNQGWMSAGPLVVTITQAASLKTGQLLASSVFEPDPQHASEFVGNTAGNTADQPANEHATSAHDSQPVPTQQHIEQKVVPVVPTPQESESQPEPQPEPEKHITLMLQDGSSRTYSVKEGSNIIGRSSEADLRLPDTGVSREHAEITWNGEDAVLVDLQSTNGTTVNDIPVDNWMLADGDVISLGHSVIEVRITKS